MEPKKRKSTLKLKRRQKKQLAFLTAVMLISAIVALVLLTPGFNIREIKIYNNSSVSSEEIIRESGIVTGTNIFRINLGDAKENILNISEIKKVEIKRVFPSTIRIDVVEEVGVGYLIAKEGYVIITADGRCIDITDGMKGNAAGGKEQVAALPDLPVIKGLKNVKYKVGSVIQSEDTLGLESLFACLKELTKRGYIFDVKEIDMSDLSDIRFFYQSRELCVSLGNANDIERKLDCFSGIYTDIVKEVKENEKPKGFIDAARNVYRETIEVPKRETVQEQPADDEETEKTQ